ncbi:MAG TPA: hypothetical protein VMA75_00900 [Candidatus Paceibacterota bacterium]|nr:hypothetical protein [Candidatus Paceibacterota bacterium]
MEYEKYILPGNKSWSLLIGNPEILIQEVEGSILIHKFKGGKLAWEKIVSEVSPEQAAALTRLGEAEGIDLSHCIYLANKHCKGFFDLVTGYRRERPRMPFTKTRFDFYAARQA